LFRFNWIAMADTPNMGDSRAHAPTPSAPAGTGPRPGTPLMSHWLSWFCSFFIFDPLIYVYTIALGSLSLLSSLFDRRRSVQHWFAGLWSRLILDTTLCPVRVIGMERIDTSRPHVYAANHLSAFDIPVLYTHLPFQFRIIAKKELFRYPFMGWHLRRSGQLAIDLDNPRASIHSLKLGVHSLMAGMPLVIFPEGGRSPNGQVQPFMNGAFYLAIKAQVDIVPMAIVGTFEILPMNHFHIKPGPIELLLGEPISVAGLTLQDVQALGNRVQKAVEDLYYSRSSVPDPRIAAAATV
jgi:1-acyl-sn-glycerol-3-phosphate acyltransferase